MTMHNQYVAIELRDIRKGLEADHYTITFSVSYPKAPICEIRGEKCIGYTLIGKIRPSPLHKWREAMVIRRPLPLAIKVKRNVFRATLPKNEIESYLQKVAKIICESGGKNKIRIPKGKDLEYPPVNPKLEISYANPEIEQYAPFIFEPTMENAG